MSKLREEVSKSNVKILKTPEPDKDDEMSTPLRW